MDVKLPYSAMKRLLINDSGLRSNGEAVERFKQKIVEFASGLSDKIVAKTKSTGRKTIYAEDVDSIDESCCLADTE
jgi:histone H3/H4